jgi:hypothetical protein
MKKGNEPFKILILFLYHDVSLSNSFTNIFTVFYDTHYCY